MENVKRIFSVLMLTTLLSVQVMAGQVEVPPGSSTPSPSPSAKTTTDGEEPPPEGAYSGSLTETTLNIVMTLLSVF